MNVDVVSVRENAQVCVLTKDNFKNKVGDI